MHISCVCVCVRSCASNVKIINVNVRVHVHTSNIKNIRKQIKRTLDNQHHYRRTPHNEAPNTTSQREPTLNRATVKDHEQTLPYTDND